jgi:hypothetical protein
MINHYDDVDPIGAGYETVNINKDTFLKDKMESMSTNVYKTTNQLEHLKQLIELLSAYSDNVFLIKKLEHIHRKALKASLDILETISDISEKYNLENEE